MAETSTKPYLLRALYEWCTDNGYTPYISVAVDETTIVPREYVRNGEIVLNISALATNRLRMDNHLIEFQARFNGSARDISVPIDKVIAIYARETGHGMAFDVPKAPAEAGGPSATEETQAGPIAAGTDRTGEYPKPVLVSNPESGEDGGPDGEPPKPTTGRPRLTVIK